MKGKKIREDYYMFEDKDDFMAELFPPFIAKKFGVNWRERRYEEDEEELEQDDDCQPPVQ